MNLPFSFVCTKAIFVLSGDQDGSEPPVGNGIRFRWLGCSGFIVNIRTNAVSPESSFIVWEAYIIEFALIFVGSTIFSD